MENKVVWLVAVIFVTSIAWLPFYKNPLYQDPSLIYYVERQEVRGKIPSRDYAMGPEPMLYVFYAISSLISKDNEILFHFVSVGYVALGNVFLFFATKLIYGQNAAIAASALFPLSKNDIPIFYDNVVKM